MLKPIITHLAISPQRTICGEIVPVCTGNLKPENGLRVGIIRGDHVANSYVVLNHDSDSNEKCERCFK